MLCFWWRHYVSRFLSYRICSTSPWRRWGCTVGWGWSSSRASVFAACCRWETLNFLHFLFAWLWTWCQGRGQGSIRRRLCSELTELLKINRLTSAHWVVIAKKFNERIWLGASPKRSHSPFRTNVLTSPPFSDLSWRSTWERQKSETWQNLARPSPETIVRPRRQKKIRKLELAKLGIAHFETVVRPTPELHGTALLVKGKPGDVNLASRLRGKGSVQFFKWKHKRKKMKP